MSKANSTARKAPSFSASSGRISKPKSSSAKESKGKGAKLDAVIQLLSRPEGATIVALTRGDGLAAAYRSQRYIQGARQGSSL